FRFHRFFGIEVSRQKLVLDIDQFERSVSRGFVERSDTSDVVAYIANFIDGQRALIVADGKDAVSVGRIFAGGHSDSAVELLRAGGIDALHAGMRIRRMKNFSDKHARK